MAQADTDFDWTTAQPVEEDETSATLTATTFGQRSMPVPTQGPVNIDTEFDWKTATLDEPFDPATAQPISEQEEQQFYQDLEVASRDPQRILTNTEHSLLYDHRQQQDDAVARFFQGAEDVPGNLLSLGMDAGTELRENWFENMFRPDRFAARNLATGMEIGRKAGVQLLQLVNWGQNKVADTIQRGNANDAKMREIAAAVPKTGDERVDGDNVMAAIAKARDEGVFEETPFGPDKEQDYERYLRQNSYARSHAGNITEATMGGKTMTFPNEQTMVLGQQPMQAVSTIGAMGLDITNALPMGAGIFSKLRVLRRLSRVTGMPLPAVERGLAGVADGMEDFGSRVAARVTDKTGLSKTQQVASLAAVSGGAGLLAANTDGMDGVLLPVAAVSGIVPAYKLVGGTIRKTSQAAGTSAMVLREMRAGNIGVVRQAAADDLLRTGTVPPQYAAYMRPYANGVESTLGRVAKNPNNPEITRKLARLADGSGVTQAVRFADDAVSSGIAATLASTPFALLAPDAEQAGAIVGGAATLGTFAGPFAGAFGRSSSRKDADIARMLIDVHAVNGDVPALISLGRDRLGQIAGMQGVVAGKTDFVTLRASDYRANVDVRATGNETGAGVFIEKASNGTARIFINVGEPASMDGKVRVRDRGDGVREVRVRGNDGRTEFIAAPKGRRLLVNDGDTVKAGQQVVDYMPPSRSMPHEIAHAILTSDILDGDIRTDVRNYVTQVYGEDGIKARGREYMAQIVDGDIMFGTHEGAVALTPEEVADVRSGKRTMSDVMKGKPVEAAERDALIDARIDEYNQRSREKGGNDYDWARDEVVAEQFAGEAKGIDFRGIRAGGPKVLESALAASARVLEVLGAKFDRTTGKPLDNPSVLFRDNPLFQSPVLRKRMIEHVRAYNDLLAGLEDAGKRETRGTKVSVDGTPDSAARSPHTKMRPDPDKGGQVGNEFLYVDETGKTQWRSPSEVRAREGSRTSQANTMYNPSRILAPNSTEFGRRTTDSGRTIVSGPTLPAQFDHFVHFPKWMREFARVLEASRERGMTFIADYNAIGDGKDGVYRVRNRGDIRAIQREVAFVGWELTGNKHLKTVLMDLNAFRASAMKAINNGELGIFNNDMQVIEADLKTYLGNHRNGLPGEAGIGQAKRDMLNGLIGTGTAVQRKANPLFSDLNPRGSVRSFRLDRYNDLTPTGREGLPFDYDKINNNRMPQQIPREAQGMPDVVDALTTDQLQRQYEENQGYLGLSTLGMREGRPVRGGAAQTRELLRRNEAISAELERRGVRSEDPQLQRALQRRGQAMPDVSDGLPRRDMQSRGKTDIGNDGTVTYSGKEPKDWSPQDFAGFGKDFGVRNLGPLSKVTTITDSVGRTLADIPGGIEGKFTYYDLLWLKANPVDVGALPLELHGKLTAKLARTMTPERGNDVQKFNGILFGMLSPNSPLLPNEFGQARMRFGSMDEIKKFAGLLPDNPTKEQRKSVNQRLKKELGFTSAKSGGLGIGISVDLSNIVMAAKLFVKKPDFFIKKSNESWANFVDKLTTQVSGLGTKTASFGGVWQDPLMAGISAMDRHMARAFSEELIKNPDVRGRFEGIVVKRFNDLVEKSKKTAKKEDAKIRRAKTEAAKAKAIDAKTEAMENLPDPLSLKADTLDDVLGQAEVFGADRIKNFVNEAVFAAMGSRKAKYTVKGGAINPNLPESLQGVAWVEAPKDFQVMSDAYRSALEINAQQAKKIGIEIFPSQWTLWDRIRGRVEPHEAMFPGLERLPALNDRQLGAAYAANKQAGYARNVKAGQEWKRKSGLSPSSLAYFTPAVLAAGAALSQEEQ
jgi:hypothetical protein